MFVSAKRPMSVSPSSPPRPLATETIIVRLNLTFVSG